MKQCVCDSLMPEELCCRKYVDGKESAPTALALMRSRYSAYVWNCPAYIFDTYSLSFREAQNREEWIASFQEMDWDGLEIVAVSEGLAKDQTGEVEFVAHYRVGGGAFSLHERSFFHREQGEWVYVGEQSQIN